MYRKIYQILEETGKVKTAMVLNGNHKGEKCLIKENHCLSSDENTADFWKKYEADLAECQETKVVHMGDVDFFVEIYVKNPQLIIFGGGHVSQPVAKIGNLPFSGSCSQGGSVHLLPRSLFSSCSVFRFHHRTYFWKRS